jgi:hypothetical protein
MITAAGGEAVKGLTKNSVQQTGVWQAEGSSHAMPWIYQIDVSKQGSF